MEKYNILQLESQIRTLKEYKDSYIKNILPQVKESIGTAQGIGMYIDDYIKLLENKVIQAKCNTEIEL